MRSYVYIHRKKTDNQIFYVGVGTGLKYYRSKSKSDRNKWWHNTVKKHGYYIQIVKDKLNIQEALYLEIFLISIIGRKDLKLGPLVNLTDGGEGTLNVIKTKDQIDKWKKSNKGKQDGTKNSMYGRTRGKHHLAKEVVNIESGVVYDSALDACDNLNMSYSTFKSKLKGKCFNDTSYVYADDLEKGYEKPVRKNKYWKKVINTKTKEVFPNLKEAAKSIGIKSYNLSAYLKGKCKNKTDFQYLSDF